MEELLRQFYRDFIHDTDGLHLCELLEKKSLVIRDDTELIRAKTKESKVIGNAKLYGIICRKIVCLEDFLVPLAESGHYNLAKKMYEEHRDRLPPNFCLPSGLCITNSPRDVTYAFDETTQSHININININNAALAEHTNETEPPEQSYHLVEED